MEELKSIQEAKNKLENGMKLKIAKQFHRKLINSKNFYN
jgi:hypothetical protein